MDWRRTTAVLSIMTALILSSGCSRPVAEFSSDKKSPPQEHGNADDGHSHERGKMMIQDAGKYHALLTAHLAPAGNELDIFFETSGARPQPVAIPYESFMAQVKRAGEEAVREVKFECAPAAERPAGEAKGSCSHFVAKVAWMQPTDSLTVVIRLTLDGGTHRIAWERFDPKKFAHHDE